MRDHTTFKSLIILSVRKICFLAPIILFAIFISQTSVIAQTNTVQIVGGSQYNSITAAWNALTTITAPVEIQLLSGYTGANETYPINLTSKTGTSSTNTITIYPRVSGLSITTSNSTAAIRFNGCSYVIIDGRVDMAGAKDLVISNTSTSASSILFINDARNSTLRYCTIKGVYTTSNNTPSGGVINFSTSTSFGNNSNTIDNCDIRDGATLPQVLIYAKGGSTYYNAGNTISNCNLYNYFSASYNSYGVYIDTYDSAWTFSGNSIYQTTTMTATAGATQYGFYLNSGTKGSYTVSGNYIGGSASNCSGSAWNVGGSFANIFVGIYNNISGYGFNNFQGNTIGNFNWSTTSAATTMPGVWSGIYSLNGNVNIGTVTGNVIGSSTGTSASVTITSSGSNAASYGLCIGSSSAFISNISQNSVSSFNVAGTTTGIIRNFYGIYAYSNSTGSVNISRNFIHNIGLSATSSTSSALYGIYLDGGTTTVQNNMASLGLDPAGNSITAGNKIYGIYENNVYNNSYNYSYYFNSLYIGGTGVASSNATASYYSVITGTNSILKNNIFVNSRSNSSGSAKNYCIYLSGSSTTTIPNITSNYNIFYANGTGGIIGYCGTDINYLDYWKSATKQDYNSGLGSPNFVSASGTNVTTDLHVQSPTPAEGYGTDIPSVTTDYDGQTRSGLTPVDIGADAGVFTASDNFPPTIIYSLIQNTSSTSNRVLTNFAVITDNIGVSTGTNLPRIYYKKSTDADAFNDNTSSTTGWKYAAADNSTSPFGFTIDYSRLYGGGTPVNGTIIQYFIVAQDDANNLSANPYGATYSTSPPVQNINGKGSTPNSYTINAAFSGTINVGTGQTYTSLTNANGLFAAINSGVLSGNLTVNIISNITEAGTNALNQISEEGAGGYTITIQSDGTLRTLSGTATATMIRINGADRVTIDGGSSKLLTFRNNNSTPGNTGATFEFTNDSKYCSLLNCTIENNSTSTSKGNVLINNTGIDTNSVEISNCDLRDPTSGTTGSPYNCIYSNFARNKVSVKNCNIYNFSNNGLNYTNVADSCTVYGNSFYCNLSTPPSSDQTSVYFRGGNKHYIYGNYIGGQSANCGGSAWVNSGTGTFGGITLASGTSSVTATSIQGNTIRNISFTGASNSSITGIYVISGGILSNIGTSSGNVINDFSIAGGTSSYFNGISVGTTTVSSNVENNTVSNISMTNSGAVTHGLRGISVAGGNVRKNRIYNISSASTGNNVFIAGIEKISSTTNNEFVNNQVSISGGNASNPTIYGFYDNSSAGYSYNFYYNSILVSGPATTSNSTYSFYKSNNTSTYQIKNNVLINNRTTGGTGFHYAIGTGNTSNWTSNYNFLASKDVNRIGNWNNSAKSFATWQTSGGDANGWSVQSGSAPLLDPANLFSDYTNGNLNVKTSGTECWYLNGKGMPLSSYNSDYAGNSRSTVITSGTTDIGSNEFTPSVNPPDVTLTPVLGLNTFSFAGKTLATVNFTTATLPSSLSLYYWSGTNPSNAGGTYGNSYYVFTPTGTNSGLNYTLVLYFDSREQNNITNLNNLGVCKSTDNGTTWNLVSGTTYTAGPPAYVTATAQTSFSQFSFTQKDNPLPVELSTFTSNVNGRDVNLIWSTESELNNQGFDIERSIASGNVWSKIGFVNGSGTKNTPSNYSFADKKLKSGSYSYRLKQIDFNGNFRYYNLSTTVEIGIPLKYEISQNYPNPFNPTTKFDFSIPFESKVKIIVYDINGKEVKTLLNEPKKAGYYSVEFTATGLSSGVYFCRFAANSDYKGFTDTKKMLLLK